MAAPRSSPLRGSVPRGAPSRPPAAVIPEAEDVADPTRPRRVVDHALERRAALRRLTTGGALSSEHFDADPYLLRAARHHGEEAGACPACKRPGLVTLSYVYGDALGPYAGRIRTQAELAVMSREFGTFRVYVVEVCGACEWNFLLRDYVLGDGVPRPAPRAPRGVLD